MAARRLNRAGTLLVGTIPLLALLIGFVPPAQPTDRANVARSDVDQPEIDTVVVDTDKGLLRGRQHTNYRTFRGVPFAAPPIGPRRWRAPDEPRPWQGVRSALESGNRCPQAESATGAPASRTEDCLYLEVTTPDTATPTHPKPVMVWLHGGGFVEGAGSEYDPRRLAIEGDVVVVTVNYRLGIFGNFGYPDLAGSGAFGIQDQQAALRWVHRNIASFGGTPDNITLFGQSAGGQSVCAQLASPTSAGLFDRAIIQSAFCTRDIPAGVLAPGLPTSSPWESAKSRAERGAAAAKDLGCADEKDTMSCLRELPVDRLMPWFGQFASPSYGNEVLPRNPYDMLRRNQLHRVPVLSGTTRDEMTYAQGLFDLAKGGPLTEREYRANLSEAFGDDAAKRIARLYPSRDYPNPSRAWAAVSTDSAMTCPSLDRGRLFARSVPTYQYEFADRSVPSPLPPVGYSYGAYHSADAYYLFDVAYSDGVRLDARQRRLADRMIRYWTAFAHHGDPNIRTGPRWPRTTPTGTSSRVLSLAPGSNGVEVTDPEVAHSCEFWDEVRPRRQ